ncbi:bifunctional folylpolyglutamate synthase/dihydrofolate synthase [Hungatella hominis]|uniref:tetrahydrofolate synthase n=1 Tax=Hungatella hominis TaxID=2763050 RepID=A0ABR7H5C7_9FIRM|nr:Mur ligase family protein [Hungatella hominis]MBC5708315.1 bifunctional folylpolyglutamate synthase/dihydrofolate synthase [Hungatella hominis]
MSLEKTAEEYLADIPMWARKKNSLEDIRAFLERMDNPDEKRKIIHVAGTNGKGSVCAYITSMLMAGGYHTGAFISPHLTEVRERFLFDGKPVEYGPFESSFREIRDLSECMTEEGYCHPSYFEFLFYMGMKLFDQMDNDFTVLETGLGGRLDTTNVIRHPLAVAITSISLDHTEYLGDTVEKIAYQKAGIIKSGVPVIYERGDQGTAAVIEEEAAASHSPVYPVDRQDYVIEAWEEQGIRAGLKRLDGSILRVLIPSQAEYQVMNALTALRTVEVLMRQREDICLSEEELKAGLESMRWPARMEEAAPGLYLDGAHNPGGIEEFIKTAARLCEKSGKRACLLFSSVSDKAHDTMIREIAAGLPLDSVAVAHIHSDRGMAKEVLEAEFLAVSDCRIYGFDTAEEALEKLLTWQDGEHLLFCVGSLYLMGEIKTILGGIKDD